MKKIIIGILLIISSPALPQTTIPSFFSNSMVLQRNDEVAMWGTDNPGKRIVLTTGWGESIETETAQNGKWKVKLKTPEAGGPFKISINGSKEIVLEDILIGEVWLCSGQSNMDMPLKGFNNQPILDSNNAILHSKNDNIRLFKAERKASIDPLEDVTGKWLSSNPSTVGDFSATAYFFAQLIEEILDVPIGIITTSWGGSTIEAWMSGQTLSQFDNIEIPREFPDKQFHKTPTLLYNGMLKPFVGYTIKGVLWYQGESNISDPQMYKRLFPALINSWREEWENDFPFYFVQIAPYSYKGGSPAMLREAQLNTMQKVENTGMAVTMDIGDCKLIHPSKKREVGERLAYWALAKTYGIDGITYSGPVYKNFKVTENGKIDLHFDHVSNGLTSFSKELDGFTIAGPDRVFYPAKAVINRDKTVTIWNEQIKSPEAVRYAFDGCPEGTLFNTAGLPASSFRTDSWEE